MKNVGTMVVLLVIAIAVWVALIHFAAGEVLLPVVLLIGIWVLVYYWSQLLKQDREKAQHETGKIVQEKAKQAT